MSGFETYPKETADVRTGISACRDVFGGSVCSHPNGNNLFNTRVIVRVITAAWRKDYQEPQKEMFRWARQCTAGIQALRRQRQEDRVLEVILT